MGPSESEAITYAVPEFFRKSEALVRDRVRAELFTHLRSAEQRLLGQCIEHAELVRQLADGFRASLRRDAASRADALARHAEKAKQWESQGDEKVMDMRAMVRRIPGTDIFCRITESADDAADDLEDAAFLSALLFESPPPEDMPEPLLLLADLLAEGAEAYRRALDSALEVHGGGERDPVQRFLEAAERIVAIEHRTDERQRAVTKALMKTAIDGRQFAMLGAVSGHLESAMDALLHASLRLRDHVLGDVISG